MKLRKIDAKKILFVLEKNLKDDPERLAEAKRRLIYMCATPKYRGAFKVVEELMDSDSKISDVLDSFGEAEYNKPLFTLSGPFSVLVYKKHVGTSMRSADDRKVNDKETALYYCTLRFLNMLSDKEMHHIDEKVV